MKTVILVGDENPDSICAVLPGKRMPSDVVRWVNGYIDESRKCFMFIVIRTYTDTIINYTGQLIEDGVIDHDSVVVQYKDKQYSYNSKGYLSDEWPYGLFNYG